ncbi:MAG: hypothetical protein K8U57_17555, partial [Planctomycetes bacterium]|nr:hypothetical protein [Planctomycetota bacterium]
MRRPVRPALEELEDRTIPSVTFIKDINPGSGSSSPGDSYLTSETVGVNVNGVLFFAADDGLHGQELWKSDGTPGGTVFVKDIYPGSHPSYLADFTNVNGTLYFAAKDDVHGVELWKSDGTAAGTVLVTDLAVGVFGSDPNNLTNVSGTLFFAANDQFTGPELWKIVGNGLPTLVKDISVPGGFGSAPAFLVNMNGVLFFQAEDPTHGHELWKSDGTEAGTVLVKDINPSANGNIYSSFPRYMTNVNGTLFFQATDDTAMGSISGGELWKSDGTEAGTVIVKDIFPGSTGSYPNRFTAVNGTVFFAARDPVHEVELWKSDGTNAGTVLVKDIRPGIYSGGPFYMENVNGTLFFEASGSAIGPELWKSDGTDAGTVLVKDINPGPDTASPRFLTNVNGTLFFTASDHTNPSAFEVWQSDGTDAGTFRLDVVPGAAGSNAGYLVNVGGTVFFGANDGTTGQELWSVTSASVPTDTAGAKITAAAFSGVATETFDKVRLTFSEAMTASSFSTNDIVFSGPNGSFNATAVTLVGGSTTQFDVTFPTQTAPGKYTLITSVDILDLASNLMNQDDDAFNGENPDDVFTFSATIAAGSTPPFFAVGDKGGRVRLLSTNGGTPIADFRPLDVGVPYTGVVEVALGDFNGDAVPDLLVSAADPAGLNDLALSKSGQVFVYDGATLLTGTIPTDPFRRFTPFATTDGPGGTGGSYVNGLNIAVGDVNGDGTLDLIAGSRGGSNVAGLTEYGRVSVIDGTSPAGTDIVIGGIQKPFGAGYQKGVVVAAGNADGVGGDEIAVTRGGPVASPNPAVQRIKVKVLQLQGGALTELHLSADGSTSFAPFGSLSGPAKAINRDGRVAFVDNNGDGKAELVFTALDPLTNPANKQIRVGVYAISVLSSGAATIVSTGPDAGPYLTGKAVVDHAPTHVAATGGQQ